MSFKAILSINGVKSGKSEFDVLSCHFNFRKNLDSRGKIISSLLDGLIHVEIESSESAKFFGYIVYKFHLKNFIRKRQVR